MIGALWAARLYLLGLSTSEWIATIGLITSSALVAQVVAFRKMRQEIKREKEAERTSERTVLWTEIEGTFDMMRATIESKTLDLTHERRLRESCEGRWQTHITRCPMFGGSRGK